MTSMFAKNRQQVEAGRSADVVDETTVDLVPVVGGHVVIGHVAQPVHLGDG